MWKEGSVNPIIRIKNIFFPFVILCLKKVVLKYCSKLQSFLTNNSCDFMFEKGCSEVLQ